MWNYLIELEWLEGIACLPWPLQERRVWDHKKTEQIQSRNKEKGEELTLWTGGIRWQLLSDLTDQQTQYQIIKWIVLYTQLQFLKEAYNGQLVRKLFQPDELRYSHAERYRHVTLHQKKDLTTSITNIRLDTDASRFCGITRSWVGYNH